MEFLLSIIFIVFGILQIILFFKLWGMTNNVSKIRDSINGNSLESNLVKEAQLLCLKEDYETAVSKYNEAFYSRIIGLYEKLVLMHGTGKSSVRDEIYEEEYKKIRAQYEKCLKRINGTIDFDKYDSFAKINEHIARMF